jgi:hypothetical protein
VTLCLGLPGTARADDAAMPQEDITWGMPEPAQEWLARSDTHPDCVRAVAVFTNERFSCFVIANGRNGTTVLNPNMESGKIAPPPHSNNRDVFGAVADPIMWNRLWRYVFGLPMPGCDRCPGGHEDPRATGWIVTPRPSANGGPDVVTISKVDGSHISRSDAEWIRRALERNALRASAGAHLNATVDPHERSS